MGDGVVNVFRWLDRHSGAIFLAGVATSLAANALAFRSDRRAARRLTEAPGTPGLPSSLPRVSFLVPAWNEAPNVEACIRSILSLRYPNKELILCAGGQDATLAICLSYAGQGVIVLEQQPGEGKQGALRRSFERSGGEIIFLTDADCVVDDVCAEATLAQLLLDSENAVTGYWEPFESLKDRPFVAYQWANHLRFQASRPERTDILHGCNAAVRRTALLAAGAFGNEAATGTDYVLAQKLGAAGFSIRSVPASRVQTEYPADIPAYLQQGSRWFRNRLVQGLKFGQWRDVVLSLWGAGASLFMLAGPLALLLRWRPVGAAWLAGFFHLCLSQARLVAFFRSSGFGRDGYLATLTRFIGYNMVSNLSMVKGLLHSLERYGRKAW